MGAFDRGMPSTSAVGRILLGTMQPETRYALVGSERVAYQVVGQGATDLVFTSGSYANVDLEWDDPSIARFLHRLASFTRLIRFDRRGTAGS